MNNYRPRCTPVAACEAVSPSECSTCFLAYDCQRVRYSRSVAWPALALAAMGLFAVIGSMA